MLTQGRIQEWGEIPRDGVSGRLGAPEGGGGGIWPLSQLFWFYNILLENQKIVSYIYGHRVMISSAYISADKCELQSTQAESPGSQTMAQSKPFLPPFGLHSAYKT